jgi:hypothetical protein
MKKPIALAILLSLYVASALGAAELEKSIDEKLDRLIRGKKWEEANQQLSKMEKTGQCEGSNCLAARALILNGQGKVQEAQESARQAAEKLGEGPALSAWRCNELGVLLFRRAAGKPEGLRLAESTFRRAAASYKGRASNIRFNLATVLRELGSGEEAKRLMDELEVEGGVLVDGSMSILGDYQGPDKQ